MKPPRKPPALKDLGRGPDAATLHKPAKRMELKVGHKYKFDFIAPVHGGHNHNGGELGVFKDKDHHIQGTVIAVYPRYYLLAQDNGRKFCINEGELGTDYDVAEL